MKKLPLEPVKPSELGPMKPVTPKKLPLKPVGE